MGPRGGVCLRETPRDRRLHERPPNGGSEVNEAISQAIEEHALTPEAVEAVIGLTERDDARERQELLVREHATLGRQMPG